MTTVITPIFTKSTFTFVHFFVSLPSVKFPLGIVDAITTFGAQINNIIPHQILRELAVHDCIFVDRNTGSYSDPELMDRGDEKKKFLIQK